MTQQDKSFMIAFSAVLGVLVVIAIMCFIIASSVSANYVQRDDSELQLAAVKRLEPVGRVVLAGSAQALAEQEKLQQLAAAGPSDLQPQDLTGEQVYQRACMACHSENGLPNAPHIGDKDAWTARYDEKGFDTLLEHAINGFNAMPAKGGHPDLSDQSIKNGMIYILRNSGMEIEEVAAAALQEQAAGEQPQPAVESQTGEFVLPEGVDLAKGEAVYNQACFACHKEGVANSPKLGDQATWAPRLAQGFDTLVEHAINGLNAMPPKGGAMNLPDEDIRAAVAYMAAKSQ